MFRNQLTRLASVGASALLAVMLLGVGGATAAVPNWDLQVTSIPTSVSPGKYVAYDIVAFNNGTSNLSQLYLTTNIPDVPFAISPSTGCATAAALSCSIGPLAAHSKYELIVVYKTPSTDSSFGGNFYLNSTGVAPNDPHRSHGDTFTATISTKLDSTINFAGGYVVAGGTSFSTDTGDVQQTTVNSPAVGIPVTIQESAPTVSQCGGSGTPIGQLATVNVNGGKSYSPFETTLKVATSSLPDETVLADVHFCHAYTDGALKGTWALLNPCAHDAAPAAGACFFAKWSGTNSAHDRDHNADADDADGHLFLIFDVWDTQNGGFRGQF